MRQKFSEGGRCKSRITSKAEMTEGGQGQVGGLEDDDDDTEYEPSDADLVESEDSDEGQDNWAPVGKYTRHDYPQFDPSGRVHVFVVGMVFDDLKQLKDVMN